MKEYVYESVFAPLIGSFKEYRIVCGHWSDFDARMLSDFDRLCVKCYPDEDALTQQMVDEWCRQRPTEKASSCIARTNAVRRFVMWLQERHMADIVCPDMPKAENHTSIPHAFTDDELHAFFHACDTIPMRAQNLSWKLKQIVIPVMFRLLYSSGMRPPEVRLLQCGDVNLDEGIVSIKSSKGPDQHFVVLHDTMTDLMRRYDKAVSLLKPDRTYFFPDQHDQPYKTMTLRGWFRTIADRCRIEGGSPYAFRHNYATTNINNWIGQGLDFDDKLVYLSKSMGHRKLQSTLWYYTLVPALSDIIEDCARNSIRIPEVYDETV